MTHGAEPPRIAMIGLAAAPLVPAWLAVAILIAVCAAAGLSRLVDCAMRELAVRPGDRIELADRGGGRVRAVRCCYTVVDMDSGAIELVPHRVLTRGSRAWNSTTRAPMLAIASSVAEA